MPIRQNDVFFAILPHIRRDTWVVVAHWPGGYKKQVTGISFWTRQEAWLWIRLEFESWLRRNGGPPMKKRLTGDVADRELTPEEQGKNAKAVARGKSGGSKGGTGRAAKLTPEQRAEIARIAAQTRWKKSS